MRSVRLALMAMLALCGTAFAREPAPAEQAPVILWHDLTTATTQAEMRAFKAQLPGDRAEVFPGCDAQVLYRLANGKLISLIFIGFDKDAACSDRILADLTARYGPPETQAVVSGSAIGVAGGSVNFTHSDDSFRWRAEGRRIVLVKQPGRKPGYNLIFTVRADKYLN